MSKTMRTALMALLVLPLAAQAPRFSLEAGVLGACESLKKATQGSTGFHLGADYATKVAGTDVPARVGVTVASMPGTETHGLKTSLTLFQLHGDVFIETGAPGLTAWVGLSANSYSMSHTGIESDDPVDVDHHFPVRDAKGVKLGLRLGMSYAFSRSWSAEWAFQQTELAGKDLQDPMVRRGGINPAWFEVGLRWHF